MKTQKMPYLNNMKMKLSNSKRCWLNSKMERLKLKQIKPNNRQLTISPSHSKSKIKTTGSKVIVMSLYRICLNRPWDRPKRKKRKLRT